METLLQPTRLPVLFGVYLALVAIIAEAFLTITPPNSYGVCLACHTMDSINWLVNRLFHASFQVQPSSLLVPLVTPFAVLAGGLAAAGVNREFRVKVASNPFLKFLLGFGVMNFALVSMGCPIRLTLLVTYGDGMAIFSLAGVIAGAVTGSWLLKRLYSR
jgi:hypothetical protein